MNITKASRWMSISGFLGILFFFISNFTTVFVGLNIVAACIQILINAFVFITWSYGFKQCRGVKRIIATFGIVVPPIMAYITITRIILPFFHETLLL